MFWVCWKYNWPHSLYKLRSHLLTDCFVKFLSTRSIDINLLRNTGIISTLTISDEWRIDDWCCWFSTIGILFIRVWNISSIEHISKVSFLLFCFLWSSISLLSHNLFLNGWQLSLFCRPIWYGILFRRITLLWIVDEISGINFKQTFLILIDLYILIRNNIIPKHIVYTFSCRSLERFFWGTGKLYILSSKIRIHWFFFLNDIERFFFIHDNNYYNDYG